jgi:hypothetical protein
MKSQSFSGMEKKLIEVIPGDDYDIHVEDIYWEGTDKPTRMESAITKEGKYIGDVKHAEYLTKELGLTQLQPARPGDEVCSIGFNPKTQEWTGWSHRALYAFGVGSQVKPGDCAFKPRTIEQWLKDQMQWHEVFTNKNVVGFSWDAKTKTFSVDKEYENGNCLTSKDVLEEAQLGEGEWEARTIDDAKKMAIDFAESVSSADNEFTSMSSCKFKPVIAKRLRTKKIRIYL